MKKTFGWIAGTALALVTVPSAVVLLTNGPDLAVYAQAPAPAALQIPNPHYVSIPMEITVNKPVADVWKRVGKFCDIGEWLPQLACTMQSGKDGELGAVRSLAGGRVLEILVAKTEYSVRVRATGPRGSAVQHVPRHTRSARALANDDEAAVHVDARQLDGARRRCREGARHPEPQDQLHASARKHEDPGRRRNAATAASPRRRSRWCRTRWWPRELRAALQVRSAKSKGRSKFKVLVYLLCSSNFALLTLIAAAWAHPTASIRMDRRSSLRCRISWA